MNINKRLFVLFILIIFSCFVIETALAVDSKLEPSEEKEKHYYSAEEIKLLAPKITKIKGLLILCERSKGNCNIEDFSQYVSSIKTKVLTSEHLDAIFPEQSIKLKDLTQKDKAIKIGKLLKASHIMLYYQKWEGEFICENYIKLINIATSEIEYQDKLWTLVSPSGIDDTATVNLFRTINFTD